MIVIVDASGSIELVFSCLLNASMIVKRYPISTHQGIVVHFDIMLQELGKTRQDIQGLAVVTGIGRFTAARLAVTAVNTLGYALHVPVIGIDKQWSAPDVLRRLQHTPVGQYVVPHYSGAAHIGGKQEG